MTGGGKQLRAVLAEAGIEPEDQQQIDKARRIVDAVNTRLAARGAPVLFCVTIASTETVRSQWASPGEFSEGEDHSP